MAFVMEVDADGIPVSDYGIYSGLDIGRQRSVLAVAERGLWYWNVFLAGGEAPVLLSYDWERWPRNRELNPVDAATARTMMLNCAGWLLSNLKPRDGFQVWEYPYPMSYDTHAGWRSAHGQAVGMQLLARAAEGTGDPRYAAPIASLLAAFRVPVAAGGVLDRTEGGVIWYEKFADAANRKPRVLNGMLFAVLGLFDIARRRDDGPALQLAEEGAAALGKMLSRFDLGDWSAYDVFGKRATPHYHRIHILQLERLHALTGDAEIGRWRDVFLRYEAKGR